MTEITGDVLDDLAETMRTEAVGKDNAITSGELADRHFPSDGEANPTTREALKILMRKRGIPLIGGSSGYFIAQSQAPIDDAIESLEGRVQGIRERQRLLAENWQAWASPDTTDAVLTAEQRAAIESDPVLSVEDVLDHRAEASE